MNPFIQWILSVFGCCGCCCDVDSENSKDLRQTLNSSLYKKSSYICKAENTENKTNENKSSRNSDESADEWIEDMKIYLNI